MSTSKGELDVTEEVTPTGDGAGENEMRMCADCLGCGRTNQGTCVYCKGSGRVLTARATTLRQQRAERLANAAPALYAALKEILNYGVEFDDTRLSYVVAQLDKCAIADARAALALVDDPQNQETK